MADSQHFCVLRCRLLDMEYDLNTGRYFVQLQGEEQSEVNWFSLLRHSNRIHQLHAGMFVPVIKLDFPGWDFVRYDLAVGGTYDDYEADTVLFDFVGIELFMGEFTPAYPKRAAHHDSKWRRYGL